MYIARASAAARTGLTLYEIPPNGRAAPTAAGLTALNTWIAANPGYELVEQAKDVALDAAVLPHVAAWFDTADNSIHYSLPPDAGAAVEREGVHEIIRGSYRSLDDNITRERGDYHERMALIIARYRNLVAYAAIDGNMTDGTKLDLIKIEARVHPTEIAQYAVMAQGQAGTWREVYGSNANAFYVWPGVPDGAAYESVQLPAGNTQLTAPTPAQIADVKLDSIL